MVEALGLDLSGIIFSIVNFLVLMAALGYFLYKPFLAMLENRKQAIQDSFDNAADINKRADEKMANYERRIAKVEKEGRELIKNAKIKAD
ncbi:MAG: ATP synthase F0 subunit B, partial [Anaerovorax sp.]